MRKCLFYVALFNLLCCLQLLLKRHILLLDARMEDRSNRYVLAQTAGGDGQDARGQCPKRSKVYRAAHTAWQGLFQAQRMEGWPPEQVEVSIRSVRGLAARHERSGL